MPCAHPRSISGAVDTPTTAAGGLREGGGEGAMEQWSPLTHAHPRLKGLC